MPVGYGKSLIFHLLPEILGSNYPVAFEYHSEGPNGSVKKQNISACRLDIKARITETNPPDSSNFMYECETQANFEDILNGKYSIVMCHPESLLDTSSGKMLLSNENLRNRVVGVIIDECHIIDKW